MADPTVSAAGSRLSDYRIKNLQSFQDATKEPRQIAGLYFYQLLDCLVDLAYKISADLRKRPQLYRVLGQLKLPRFRGHRTIWVRGVHDGQDKSSLPA
jgi:hypothetical protein